MKVLVSSRNTLGICAVVTMLAGCGGGPNLTPTQSTGLLQNTRDVAVTAPLSKPATGFLNGEVFKGRHVHITPVQGCESRAVRVNFTASGKARGPHRGTFTATGQWEFVVVGRYYSFWGLTEYFTISSGTSRINGEVTGSGQDSHGPTSCSGFAAYDGLSYSVQSETGGNASTTGISEGVLGESFQ